MAKLTDGQRETFQVLRRTYLEQVPDRIAAIRRSATEAARRGARRETREDLRQLAHQLVGSAAIFGLPHVCSAARALEELASRLLDGAPAVGEFEALVAALEAAGNESVASPRRSLRESRTN
jgi:HPt (histidine-containing phosphotransfer) domain-containing protein